MSTDVSEPMDVSEAPLDSSGAAPDDSEAPADARIYPELCVGSLVRLVNLNRAEFNNHVGCVATGLENGGRIGVSLHSSIFEDNALRRRIREYPPMSFKRENLREVARPVPGMEVSVWGTVSKQLIQRLFGETGWGLPGDVAGKIADRLSLHILDPSEVSVSGCSSSRGDFPISAALNANENEWWISSAGSMPRGRGSEYLEFSFGKIRRVSFVALKIPPLPHGPLSVREFHVMLPGEGKSWVAAAQTLSFQTLDRGDLQELALHPPCEAEKLRLVCTLNAAAASQGGETGMFFTDCIGLFQVAFA
mmetsp:Transcript_120063/g.224448  ORF Transcript_120063/g.224448 Transcript_120063/m.224448 type:complete len:306 (+) Transcript_120063:81-998(+)